jgi:DNA polymerase I-like protein with 3'-5' exonuclease and polymerase domains
VRPRYALTKYGQLIWESWGQPTQITAEQLLAAAGAVAAAGLLARHWPKEGARQDAALALAGGLVRAGWTLTGVERAEKFIEAVATAAGDDEVRMRVQTVQRTAEKIAAAEQATGWPALSKLLSEAVVRQAREWLRAKDSVGGTSGEKTKPKLIRVPEPYCPFPVQALPQPIREFVVQGAAALNVDPSFLALPALAAAASLIGNSRAVCLKRDWVEPCVLWVCVVGDSGTLKTPALKMSLSILYRIQRELLDAYTQALNEYDRLEKEYEQRKREAKKKKTEFHEEPPEPPTKVRIITGDVTIEKLAELLEDNPRGLLASRDELSGWLGSFCRYKGKSGGSDLPNWLEMYSAGNLLVDRKTGERTTLFIPHAAVSVVGGIQPGVLARALCQDYLEAGLGARILVSMPPKIRKVWSEAEVAPEVREAYENTMRALLSLTMEKNDQGERVPFVVKLTPEAKQAWVAFYGEWAREQAAVEGVLAAAFSKLEGAAARLALIHHVVERARDLADCDPITPASIQAGVALVRWFANEARRIYSALAEDQAGRDFRKLIELIRSHGGRMTARRLHLSNRSRHPDAEAAEQALEQLVHDGLADWEAETGGAKRGRPSRTLVLRTDTTYFKNYENPPDDDEGPSLTTTEETTKNPGPSENAYPSPNFVVFEACSIDPSRSGGSANQPPPISGNDGILKYESTEPLGPPTNGTGPENDVGPCFKNYENPSPSLVRPLVTWGGPVVPPLTHAEREDTWQAQMIDDPNQLQTVLQALDESEVVALDIETTGLNPRQDRARLLSLAMPDRGTYVIDVFAVDPRPAFELLAEKKLIGHNLVFDLGFLAQLRFQPGKVCDTMLLSQLLSAGQRQHRHNLRDVAERYLGRKLDKEEQKGDWSGTLTPEQLRYAATDAEVLLPLHRALESKVREAKLEAIADLENRCLPGISWLVQGGVGFDQTGWSRLANEARADSALALAALNRAAPTPQQTSFLDDGWNWDSREQVKQAFLAVGIKLEKTDDDTLAAVDHPLAGLLRDYRGAQKRVSTYGEAWFKGQIEDGRVYAGWVQCGSDAGRMSCRKPNLQNLPRGPQYRRCFAAPPGRVLVKADYSQIELRIAAKIADEPTMLDAYRNNLDLHTLTARRILGKEEVTKADRQLAKSVNFGLLYGMGANGFRDYARSNYGVELTEDEARQYRDAFFQTYPGLRKWHRNAGATNDRAIHTWTLGGRRRTGVTRFTEKLNTPVQGTGADGLKAALGLLWERRQEVPGAFPVLVVHDEIVVECDLGQSEAVSTCLKRTMIDGMAPLIDPVPVEVEASVAPTWGG